MNTDTPKLDPDNQHTRLRAAREKMKISASEAARSMGVNPSTYTHHENGTRTYGEEEARKYARRLKTTPEYLLLGITSTQKDLVREVDSRAGAGGGGVVDFIQHTQDNGYTIAADAVRDVWQMPDSFIRGELRMDARSAWVVEVQGDSGYDPVSPNAPGSIFPNDRVIVDTRDRRPSPPGPFLVHDGVGLVVKLVEIVPNTDPARIRLSSRNPSYSPYEAVEGEARIIGRVRGRISAM